MNEVTLLQVKTHWSTLKEFDCIIQTQNCEINTLQEKKIMSSHKRNYPEVHLFVDQLFKTKGINTIFILIR